MKSIAEKRTRVVLQNPGPAIPDGDGGFTQAWIDLAPVSVQAHITAATAEALSRVASGTVIETATHIVTIWFHPQVSIRTRIVFDGRTFHVAYVGDPDEKHVELVLICVEVLR